MTETLLPLSIQDDRNLAFEAVVDRLREFNLAVLAVYDINTVPASALFDLADQFTVLGLRGWTLATTASQRRELIKNAIRLHQTAGTPFAIKRAMELVGYPDATIQENPGTFYDGSLQYDGTWTYSGAQFGAFVVTLDSQQAKLSGELIDLIVGLINEWKNARSYLLDLRIGDISLFSNLLQYDGNWVYNGNQEYDGERNI